MDRTPEQVIAFLIKQGYPFVVRLETGEYAGVARQIFTTGLFVGLDDFGYRCRYCFETQAEATAVLFIWDGKGDPPGGWIKRKGEDGEYLNPNLATR